jgi:predicted amidohydrolase
VKDLRIAAVQMNALLGQVEQNLATHRRWIERAARAKADLVCFPELSISGHFCHKDSWRDAEPMDGPSVRQLSEWARKIGVEEMVVTTLRAADREQLFPAAKLLQRRTELFKPLVANSPVASSHIS